MDYLFATHMAMYFTNQAIWVSDDDVLGIDSTLVEGHSLNVLRFGSFPGILSI